MIRIKVRKKLLNRKICYTENNEMSKSTFCGNSIGDRLICNVDLLIIGSTWRNNRTKDCWKILQTMQKKKRRFEKISKRSFSRLFLE